MTRRRRRSKSYAHERWLTTHYFFKNQVRGCCYPLGAEPVTAGEAFTLGSHAMRIRDHALPPTKITIPVSSSFIVLSVLPISYCRSRWTTIAPIHFAFKMSCNAGTTSDMPRPPLPLFRCSQFVSLEFSLGVYLMPSQTPQGYRSWRPIALRKTPRR